MDIKSIKDEIDSLPKGYISNKTINGKTRHYLQWNESGKIKSRYIKNAEYETVKAQLERRKELQSLLKTAEIQTPQAAGIGNEYKTNVVFGDRLDKLVSEATKLDTRDCYSDIEKYLYGPVSAKVMVVYGLRRTGKTTLLFQAIGNMNKDRKAKAFYIKAQKGQTMDSLCKDINSLYEKGFRYAFLDEITFIDDFIDTASVLSDIYASMGMKIVISGKDSLGLWLASKNELYDRTLTIHTTWISFEEHARLLNTDDVDDYIRYGGTLRAGEYDFDDPKLQDESVAFRDDESTRRYIDTAICRNIQHSLKCYESGTRFMHLQELYEAGELTNAIYRIIENMNHRFVLDVLEKDFSSSDLKLAEKNLLKEKNLKLRTDSLTKDDKAGITARLMQILEIKNKPDTEINLREVHIEEIKAYLEALDLIEKVPIRYAYGVDSERESIAVTQPGMRYSQAEALVWSLKKDALFADLAEAEKEYIIGKILDEVKGRMLEEIVLSETKRKLDSRRFDVFKYQFIGGEIDMIVYDRKENTSRLYEIKHSTEAVKEQCTHLLKDDECKKISDMFGEIAGKYVIYRGDSFESDWEISYLNAADFLTNRV